MFKLLKVVLIIIAIFISVACETKLDIPTIARDTLIIKSENRIDTVIYVKSDTLVYHNIYEVNTMQYEIELLKIEIEAFKSAFISSCQRQAFEDKYVNPLKLYYKNKLDSLKNVRTK